MEEMKLIIKEGLTANNVTAYKNQLEYLLKDANMCKGLILDMGQTDNIDSVGVTFVIGIYKRMKEIGKTFKVVGASQDVQMLFKLMKLDAFFEMSE